MTANLKSVSINTRHLFPLAVVSGLFLPISIFAQTIPALPVLLEPADGAVGIDLGSYIRWEGVAADSQSVQIAADSGFTDLILNLTRWCQWNQTTTEFDCSFGSDFPLRFARLERGKTFFWRVRGKSLESAGPWTNAWSFTVEDLRGPDISSPVTGETNVQPLHPFDWELEWVDGYHIQFASDDAFQNIVFDDSTTQSGITLPLGVLKFGSSYYWRVRGHVDGQSGQWSSTGSFRVRQRDYVDLTEGDGYMVAGDLWDTIKPMNSAEDNGVEDNLRDEGFLHYLTIGPDGANWADPVCFWPGGYHITNCWRDGRRMTFSVFESDDWATYGYTDGNRVWDAGDEGLDSRFMMVYYSPHLQGANDPSRNYKRPAEFTDAGRTHLVYEAGWPTTAGIDFQIRAHQYTSNEQNLNDFITLEISMTNTGVVDTDGDGTPEVTDHVIDAMGIAMTGSPTTAVLVQERGVLHSWKWGAGRTMGYWATPDEEGDPIDVFAWYANTPVGLTSGHTEPGPGNRIFGINNGRDNEGYTDVWNSWRWNGVKQGHYSDGLSSTSPDKQTLFGTHPVGERKQRGWYASTHWESSLHNWDAADAIFRTATATWYENYGKWSYYSVDLNPNSSFFSRGTADDVTTFVVGNTFDRPNGDSKYATEDVGQVFMQQPVWEPKLNPGAEDGSDFFGGVGWNLEYTFGQALVSGIGPFGFDVGETITVVFTVAAGYRSGGVLDAYDAADWAWERSWDISADIPTPPSPDILVESTANGTAGISWTDVSDVGSVDGYKIWRSSNSNQQEYLERGFRGLDKYHHQHDVNADPVEFLEPVNPNFDNPDWFVGDTEGVYNPAEWGSYDLIAKIPNSELEPHTGKAASGYDFAFEDEDAELGSTYWYYVSAYTDGSFTGPQGPVAVGHIESSNWNRNGRNSPLAADGELGVTSPWGGTYPFAERSDRFPVVGTRQYKNIGRAFVVGERVVSTQTEGPTGTFSVNQNFPNPFSGSTTIVFELEAAGPCQLDVFNVMGQRVGRVVDATLAAGQYRVNWEGRSEAGAPLPSGVYVYRLSAGRQSAVQTMLLVR